PAPARGRGPARSETPAAPESCSQREGRWRERTARAHPGRGWQRGDVRLRPSPRDLSPVRRPTPRSSIVGSGGSPAVVFQAFDIGDQRAELHLRERAAECGHRSLLAHADAIQEISVRAIGARQLGTAPRDATTVLVTEPTGAGEELFSDGWVGGGLARWRLRSILTVGDRS